MRATVFFSLTEDSQWAKKGQKKFPQTFPYGLSLKKSIIKNHNMEQTQLHSPQIPMFKNNVLYTHRAQYIEYPQFIQYPPFQELITPPSKKNHQKSCYLQIQQVQKGHLPKESYIAAWRLIKTDTAMRPNKGSNHVQLQTSLHTALGQKENGTSFLAVNNGVAWLEVYQWSY